MSVKSCIAITISRQVGAGGAALGQRLAQRLGYAYLDRAILQAVADRMGITDGELEHLDEHVSRFWERLVETFAGGCPDAIYAPPPLNTEMRDEGLFQLEAQVIREAASKRDVIIIGRGGFHVLRGHPGLVSVCLHAPVASRLPRVMCAHDFTDERKATEWMKRTDADRERFIHEMTGRTPGDARCYHLCIDTCRVGLDLAEEMVLQLVERTKARLGSKNAHQNEETPH